MCGDGCQQHQQQQQQQQKLLMFKSTLLLRENSRIYKCFNFNIDTFKLDIVNKYWSNGIKILLFIHSTREYLHYTHIYNISQQNVEP